MNKYFAWLLPVLLYLSPSEALAQVSLSKFLLKASLAKSIVFLMSATIIGTILD